MTTQIATQQRFFPVVRYHDANAGLAWLTSVLGFREHLVCRSDEGAIDHAELELNGNIIMVGGEKDDAFGKSPKTLGASTGTLYIAVEDASDIDRMCERARAAGARIVREPVDMEYGSREFSVSDPEGHLWSFGTYRPTA